jgi:hypothetical protein
MKIQSLSVVVPNEKCINNCAFCVSKMHDATYPNLMDINDPLYDLHLKDYLKRLAFARDNGCNTVMLTGTSEPQQNKQFLTMFGLFMQMLDNPFKIIEMQTAGTLLDADYLRFLRHHVGVNTISLSLSSLDSFQNAEYNGIPHGYNFVISTLCQQIKHEGFTLRLSLNLTDAFNGLFDNATGANYFLKACKDLDADQITFRVLYGDKDTPQGQWIKHHGCTEETITNIKKYIRENGKALGVLEFGATRYSLAGMSTVLDTDCMSTTPKTEFKYLILRPDCKLYSHWNDKASLIF